MAEGLHKRLQNELEKYKSVQKEYQKCLSARQQLDAQLNENKLVKTEMDLLEDESTVYKMVGPVLIKQDQVEAKQTIQKRIDYISEQMKKQDGLISELEKKQESHRDNLSKLQHQFQQSQVKAAARA